MTRKRRGGWISRGLKMNKLDGILSTPRRSLWISSPVGGQDCELGRSDFEESSDGDLLDR